MKTMGDAKQGKGGKTVKRLSPCTLLLPAAGMAMFILCHMANLAYGMPSGSHPQKEGFQSEGEKALPPLIVVTTLEEDYGASARLGLTLTPFLLEEDPNQAFENILCSCVFIQAKGYYGSGSIFKMGEEEIIIVTNRHLLRYWDEDSYVTFFNGAAGTAEVLGISQEADVGFLRVPVGNFTYEELLLFRNIRMRKDGREEGEAAAPKKGEKFFSVDTVTRQGQPVMREGVTIAPLMYLEDFGMEMFYGRAEAVPGMSGSGIFDGYGNYLGMLTGGNLAGEIAAVPAQDVYHEYCKVCR